MVPKHIVGYSGLDADELQKFCSIPYGGDRWQDVAILTAAKLAASWQRFSDIKVTDDAVLLALWRWDANTGDMDRRITYIFTLEEVHEESCEGHTEVRV